MRRHYNGLVLFYSLYEKGVSNTKDIKWHTLLLSFDGFTKKYLYKMFINLIRGARIKSRLRKLAGNSIEYTVTYLSNA